MASYNAFAQYYDRFQRTVDYAQRAAYFDGLFGLHRAPEGLTLDLACGTGSLSLELARLGHDVIGVDASEQMLCEAQQKMYDAEQRVLFLCQRMEQLDLYGTVTRCVCALDSLNHLTDEAALSAAIGRVSLFLEPGGVFLFDMNTPYKQTVLLGDNSYVFEDEDTMCVWQNDTEGELTTISLDFFTRRSSGLYRRESEEFCERVYPIDTVKRICHENGLSVCAIYADDTLDAPCETSQRYIFAAKKEG